MDDLAGVAEAYTKLVLALGRHDEGYVDAFYGPTEWQAEVEREALDLGAIRDRAAALRRDLEGDSPAGAIAEGTAARSTMDGELLRLRRVYLSKQLGALVARVEMLQGRRFRFDEESQALYDAVAPRHTEAELAERVARLEGEVLGSGPLAERMEAYRQRFAIPKDRLDAVFSAAIQEARRRTAAHVALPEGERFTVEYVTDQPWSGYNWYQGGFASLIQVNTDLPIFIGRAVSLAAHEGYPGHHVYNALLERHLVRERGWREFTVYPLYSPQSLIAEGTANLGVEIAFPREERVWFEREVLFPLAGLDAAEAEQYGRIEHLSEGLGYAGNEAARRYLDGEIGSDEAAAWHTRYGLMSPARAQQRVRFVDRYRSYVINYNLGKDLVRGHVAARVGTADQPERPEARWPAFVELLMTPRVPSTLELGPTVEEAVRP